MQDDLLKKITDSIGILSLSETKVASCIIADPQIVAENGMAAIAAEAEVSEPTVMRFCRSMGFSGFSDFKKSFISFLIDGGVENFTVVSPTDSIHNITLKKHLVVRQQLASVVDDVEREELQRICNSLVSATTIAIFTDQLLLPTAYSARNSLLNCGLYSVIYSNNTTFVDVLKTLPQASSLLFLSERGTDPQMEASIRAAKEKRFTSISLTKRYSPLAAESDFILYFPEDQPGEFGNIDYLNFSGLLLVSFIHSILQKMR